MASFRLWVCGFVAGVLGAPTLAQGVSFIGCDQAPRAGLEGPHRGWEICQVELPIADVRGQGAAHATRVAISGSNAYVILKAHGHRADVIRRAELVLRDLAAGGYPALGLVLGDGPGTTVMEVFSGGRPGSYDVIRNVDAPNGELAIREVVVEAYERDIGPRRAPNR